MAQPKKYYAKLRDGRDIYIPNWPVDVALENLAQAGKVFGTPNVIRIAEGNMAAAINALTKSDDPKLASALIKHFICQARIDSKKIEPDTLATMFEGELFVVMELFMHVLISQYADFFALGLVKEHSQEQSPAESNQ